MRQHCTLMSRQSWQRERMAVYFVWMSGTTQARRVLSVYRYDMQVTIQVAEMHRLPTHGQLTRQELDTLWKLADPDCWSVGFTPCSTLFRLMYSVHSSHGNRQPSLSGVISYTSLQHPACVSVCLSVCLSECLCVCVCVSIFPAIGF